MVNTTNNDLNLTENIDGVTPVDFPVLGMIKEKQVSIESLMSELMVAESSYSLAHQEGDPLLLRASIERATQRPITNDISRSAQEEWDRVKNMLHRYQSELYSYSRVIQLGTENLAQHIEMLYDMTDGIKTKPYDKEITIKTNKKYNIDGKFEPVDIRPLLELTQTTLDFHDKVLVNLIKQLTDNLSKLQLDNNWTEDTNFKFEMFSADKWFRNGIPVENDERFRVNSNIIRSRTAQANKAIFYAGPPDVETEKVNDWGYVMTTMKNIRYKYFTVDGLNPINEEDNVVKVNPVMSIRQRLSYILNAMKRLEARKGYGQKLADLLRRLESSADNIRNAAKIHEANQQRNPNTTQGVNEEKPQEGKPVSSVIVKDLATIMHQSTRLVTDYNNSLAGLVRLAAALTLVADRELKSYQPPLRKPTQQEIQDKKV